MKYEIKEGMATIPISEINRLNADAEELEVREEMILEREREFSKMIAEKKVVTMTYDYRPRRYIPVKIEYHDKDGLIEKLVPLQFAEELYELESLRKKVKSHGDIKNKILFMSKRELLKFQKELQESQRGHY